MTTLRYKEYQGEVLFDQDRLLIKILHIDDLITTEVEKASEAQAAFEELVEDYLETCAAVGKEPSKPFRGTFNIRISPVLHKAAAISAADAGQSLNSWIEDSIRKKLNNNSENITTEEKTSTNQYEFVNNIYDLHNKAKIFHFYDSNFRLETCSFSKEDLAVLYPESSQRQDKPEQPKVLKIPKGSDAWKRARH